MHELALCSVENDGATVLTGYVRTFEDGVLWVGTEGLVRGIGEGETLTARVHDEVRGECVYVGEVARVTADTVAFAGVELLATLQKRAAARVAVTLGCEGFLRVPPPDDGDGAGHGPEAPLRFTVLDVSAHGMRMMSPTELPPGSTIRFVFPELSDAFWLQAVVVRSQPSRTGTHYGCRFVETSPRETDELFRYVLRTQGAQRRQQTLA